MAGWRKRDLKTYLKKERRVVDGGDDAVDSEEEGEGLGDESGTS